MRTKAPTRFRRVGGRLERAPDAVQLATWLFGLGGAIPWTLGSRFPPTGAVTGWCRPSSWRVRRLFKRDFEIGAVGRWDLLQDSAQLLGSKIGESHVGRGQRLVWCDAPFLKFANERDGVRLGIGAPRDRHGRERQSRLAQSWRLAGGCRGLRAGWLTGVGGGRLRRARCGIGRLYRSSGDSAAT